MLYEILIIVFLIALAIFLVILEIFFLPGITVAGIGGAIFAIGAYIYAYSVSEVAGHITIGGSIILFVATFLWFMRSRSFHRVSLKADVDSTLTSTRDLGIQPGDDGVTLSRLAPIGKARILDKIVEAKSTGEFIDEDTPIEVIRVDGYNVLVRPKQSEETI